MQDKFNFFGINTTVETDDPKFLYMVKSSLDYFKPKGEEQFKPADYRYLKVRYSKHSILAETISQQFLKIGRGLYISDNQYLCFLGRIGVRIRFLHEGIIVEACPLRMQHPITTVKRLLKSCIIGEDYFYLARILVLYPVFWILEHTKHIFLLHASAVNYKGKGLIFAGLSGVGKTILALKFTLDAGAKFICDNFLLWDEKTVYPFPEFVRLPKDAKLFISNISKLQKKHLTRFKREYFTLHKSFISVPTKPSALFITNLSDKMSIKKLSKAIAMDRLLLLNDKSREFHHYHAIGLMDYIDKNREKSCYQQRVVSLERFLENLSLYELSISNKEEPIERLKSWI